MMTDRMTIDEAVQFHTDGAFFKANKQKLREQYGNQYIVIYDGKIVEAGPSQDMVLQRFYAKFGNLACWCDNPSIERPPLRI